MRLLAVALIRRAPGTVAGRGAASDDPHLGSTLGGELAHATTQVLHGRRAADAERLCDILQLGPARIVVVS